MVALSAANGTEIWRRNISSDWMPHAVSDGMVYAGSGDQQFFRRFATVDRAAFPVIVGGVVYVGITGHGSGTPTTPRSFYALDLASGDELWHFTDSGLMLEGEPAVVDDALYVPSVSGKLYASR